LSLVRAGDGSYCLIGEWDSFNNIVAARPNMLANLDRIRHMLVELSAGLGVTDPLSGEAVFDKAMAPRAAKSRKKMRRASKRRAARKMRASKPRKKTRR
jgi:hypothetical protein